MFGNPFNGSSAFSQISLLDPRNKALLEEIIRQLAEQKRKLDAVKGELPHFVDRNTNYTTYADDKMYVYGWKRFELTSELANKVTQRIKQLEAMPGLSYSDYYEDEQIQNLLFQDRNMVLKSQNAFDLVNISIDGDTVVGNATSDAVHLNSENGKDFSKNYQANLSKILKEAVESKNMELAIRKHLIWLATNILNEAVKLCPKKTGYLARSGTFVIRQRTAVIAFTAPYAKAVHENFHGKYGRRTNHDDVHFTGRYMTKKGVLHLYNPYRCYGGEKFLERAIQKFITEVPSTVEFLPGNELTATITVDETKYREMFLTNFSQNRR